LLLRKLDSAKDRRRVLRRFAEGRDDQEALPPASPVARRLLLIRLDDIGDYVLFRSRLQLYRAAPKWKDHVITLLGNSSWKELFEELDADTVDEALWLDKNRYLQNAAYRHDVWMSLRRGRFETVVAPSRTRPLLLDDLCTLAAAPGHAIGSANNYIHPSWNAISDAIYESLYQPLNGSAHELEFNHEFAVWACGVPRGERIPRLAGTSKPYCSERYILCFIGANIRSKRWPAARWVELIRLFRRHYSWEVILAGAGDAEFEMAGQIQAHAAARSLVNQMTLPQILGWVGHARAVVSNDTMAAHLGALCRRPTVIIANGVNYSRFTDYAKTGLECVATVYPEVFSRRRARRDRGTYDYIHATSADIASICPKVVFQSLESVLGAPPGRHQRATVRLAQTERGRERHAEDAGTG
jgi:ADP-heptose:LPS heptosyltransferase